jgi:N-acetylglucosaminyldiphosphoundecaprenol N-acetyl-beta-D-mannosaminyltransferase
MQQAGLEWIWRLSREPRRLWRRYVVDLGVFSLFFFRQWWAMRRGKASSLPLPAADLLLVEDVAVLNVQGQMTVSDVSAFQSLGKQALAKSSRFVIHLQQAEFLDSSALGALVGLAKLAREAGGELVFAAVPKNICTTLALLRLDTFFPMFADLDSALAAQSAPRQAVALNRQLLQEEG